MNKQSILSVRLQTAQEANLQKFAELKNTNQGGAIRLILDEFFKSKNDDDKHEALNKKLDSAIYSMTTSINKISSKQSDLAEQIENSKQFLNAQINGIIQANQKLAEMLLLKTGAQK
jgi:hypothetical protein